MNGICGRREFLSLISTGPMVGANAAIRVGIVGCGGRGRSLAAEFLKHADCRVTAVCDINQRRASQAVAELGAAAEVFADLRRLFDARRVDLVVIATPNHWHALATIWACQAGLDVYVEKPACHNIFEGRKMVEAARKYQRIVQVGSQNRSVAHNRRAVELLRAGVVGKLYYGRGICYRRRPSIGHAPPTTVPAGLDWDLFLGPAPLRPYSRNRYDYNWHWIWETGNGDIGNQGIHELDLTRWGLGVEHPSSVVSTGNKAVYDDDQETPNMQLADFDFGDQRLTFDVRGLPTNPEAVIPMWNQVARVGNFFYGTDGYVVLHPRGFQVYKGERGELVRDEKVVEAALCDSAPHVANFLDAVRRRDYRILNADIETGVNSAALAHLANISYHRRSMLKLDRSSGAIVGDSAAEALTRRVYRAPFVVPEKV